MLRDAAAQDDNINLEEYTSSDASHVSKCVDDVVTTKATRSISKTTSSPGLTLISMLSEPKDLESMTYPLPAIQSSHSLKLTTVGSECWSMRSIAHH